MRGDLGGWQLCQSKAHPHFTMHVITKFCSICRRLAAIPMPPPPIRLLIWGAKVDLGGRKSRPKFLLDFYTYSRPFLYRLATIHNVADSQTDGQTYREMAIGRLCYSIRGLKMTECSSLSVILKSGFSKTAKSILKVPTYFRLPMLQHRRPIAIALSVCLYDALCIVVKRCKIGL